jgi:CrcB protein
VANKTRNLFSLQIKWYIHIIDCFYGKRANMAAAQLVSTQWLAVGCGAALGAWVRWGLSIALNASMLPLGTLIANLSGGLLMGMALAYFASTSAQDALHHTWRLLVMTGFLGGLTTFSAFSAEAFTFLQKQQYVWAIVHISSHVVGSLLMTATGFALVHYLRN